MSGQCSQCGALLQAGTRFCGTCGAAAGGQAKTGGAATTAWVVAVVAIGLLGAALAYIFVSRDEAEPVAADAAAPVAGTAEPAPAQPAKPLPMADTATPPAAFVPSPAPAPDLPARAVPARVGNGSSDAGLIGSYRAWIGNADLYASDGVRLTRPWQILRQDRANVHRFGIVDPGDQNDAFFASANARAIMERMVMNGSIDPSAARRIAAGGIMVTVSIYGRGSRGDYVDVIVE